LDVKFLGGRSASTYHHIQAAIFNSVTLQQWSSKAWQQSLWIMCVVEELRCKRVQVLAKAAATRDAKRKVR
jgi:hypothetical protein